MSANSHMATAKDEQPKTGAFLARFQRWGHLSISSKLALLFAATLTVALLLTSAAFVFFTAASLKKDRAVEIEALAEMIARNSTAALTFRNEEDAADVLASLSVQPTIVYACLYDSDSTVFATYVRRGTTIYLTSSVPDADTRIFTNGLLLVYRPILLNGRRIGTVHIQSDLSTYRSALDQTVRVSLAIVLLCGLAAFLLSLVLRRAIIAPIHALADTAQSITRNQDYSVRAPRHAGDELGDLATQINYMLDEIERRDAELKNVNCLLEERIAKRTFELAAEVEVRRRAEETLKANAVLLGKKNKELEEFAQVASHDLQEPLRKVRWFGERLAAYKGTLPEEGADSLDRMLNATSRMQQLINDLLTFSRVTFRGHPFARVDLNEVLTNVLSDLEVQVAESAATIRAVSLPTIAADPTQMRQLFQNLIGNSLKYRKANTTTVVHIEADSVRAGDIPEIHADVGPDAAICRLTFRDNGIGFEQKYAERIFGLFQRLHGRDQYSGTGIGLAVCRRIVERHHGTIVAVGVPNEGAQFVVYLPVNQPEVVGTGATSKETAGTVPET